MDLYVDIGNSAVKWANARELEAGDIQAVSSKEIDTILIDRWQSLAAPDRVCLSSVLQESKLAWLKAWILRHWRIEPVMAVTRARELGVTNGYREPTQLGVDRWLALLSARSLSQGPVLVVDCGTATTIDAMDEKGHHLGGVILPGLQLFRHCLKGNTDLPPLNESDAIEYFATDTATGITSGAMLATVSSVERMTQMLQTKNKEKVICLLTGGQAGSLSRQLGVSHQFMPNLVLQGLALQMAVNVRP